MALIGEFDVAVREADPDTEPDTFKFCGVEFVVPEHLSSLPLLEFAKAAALGADLASIEGMAATHDFIRATIRDEDWAKFSRVAKQHNATGDDLLAVARGIVAAVTGRPTSRLSDSAGGPSSTGENSRELSSSDASSNPEDVPAIQKDPRVLALVPVEEAGRQIRQQLAS